jgi:hypothetical protein
VKRKRRVYQPGVPHPQNAGRPDEFQPGPGVMILAEYTAEYEGPDQKSYQVRLVSLAVANIPGRVHGFGWELDPSSSPPARPTAHFSQQWVKSVHAVSGGHMIEIRAIGWFFIETL